MALRIFQDIRDKDYQMLRNTTITPFAWMAIVVLSAVLSACATTYPRYDGKTAPDPTKAVLIGSITEGFLTQPHGLEVYVVKATEPATALQLQTLGGGDDLPPPNLLGNFFMYEVPAGQYEIKGWRYHFYAGTSKPAPAPIVFTVKPGEIAYIGDFYANALTFCLSNIDHAESIAKLKAKYPMLQDRSISNVTAQSGFGPWPSTDAKDNGKGICNFF
jgi:hypothetical protein